MEDVSFQSETKILFKKYKVKRKISQIDFKKVYLGKKIIDNELVAIKVEKKNIPNPSLESEAFILTNIKGPGIPKFITYGHTKSFRVLVMSLLGPNLEEIFLKKTKTIFITRNMYDSNSSFRKDSISPFSLFYS